jgi:predicted nucleic acid-binding protein
MKYLFDSSAIFRAIKENRVEVLVGSCTLDLARYELGNIVWKDYALQQKVSEEEARKMTRTIKRTIDLMDVLGIAGFEEEILETATRFRITFYDASYACHAKTRALCLITEDSRLTKRIAPAINVSTLDSVK